jgi:hypothetical protein
MKHPLSRSIAGTRCCSAPSAVVCESNDAHRRGGHRVTASTIPLCVVPRAGATSPEALHRYLTEHGARPWSRHPGVVRLGVERPHGICERCLPHAASRSAATGSWAHGLRGRSAVRPTLTRPRPTVSGDAGERDGLEGAPAARRERTVCWIGPHAPNMSGRMS